MERLDSMSKEMPITQARDELMGLSKRLAKASSALAVTHRGERVLAIMPWALYESLIETLEILQDVELMAGLRRGLAEAEAGKGVLWDNVKDDLKTRELGTPRL